MKAFGIISLMLTMAIVAYLMVRQQEPGSAGVSANAAKSDLDRARQAAATANAEVVKRAVKAFQAEKQRFPKDLEELKEAGYIQTIPADLAYSPESGEVTASLP